MKQFLTLFASVVGSVSLLAQTPCENGFAGIYPCEGYDLQSHIGLATMNASAGNDSWGWTDPQDGKEYAIMCLNNGTAFIDISDPVNPIYLGKLPTQDGSSTWRDAKVYDNHVFIVSDANPSHGMQVFDLTRLRNVANPPQTFTNDAHYNGFGSAHNIAINEDTGFAYAVGTSTFSGGPHFINIQNPTNPQAAGGFSTHGYCHDAQIVVYNGPDADYTGQEILIGSNAYQLSIVDVTDKNNPVGIATLSYPNVAYTHQGWFTEDQRFFILGDEIDEIEFGFNTRTLIFDLQDLDNPQLHFEYYGPTAASDHNGYVVGDKFYLANYTAGLRVIDVADLENQNMFEIGHFDTHPPDDNPGYNNAWNVYPFFESGNIVISDTQNGFFLVKSNAPPVSTPAFDTGDFTLYPNPAGEVFSVASKNTPLENLALYNTLGQQVLSFDNLNTTSQTLDISTLPKGLYTAIINGTTVRKLMKK